MLRGLQQHSQPRPSHRHISEQEHLYHLQQQQQLQQQQLQQQRLLQQHLLQQHQPLHPQEEDPSQWD
ncbi:hypothetical protein ETH_00027800 [Eimeria tenella]|uniref:Uncharacterized protein n=1 Tax=Eimeria tenella TaxID=5802 RepID=U6L584_EIMTE|nr:hypothetical protein ETH_00027800 [Eimeria tenella]CDJ45552.1 hypothetical protein ETH_00027800 [Eimeria tenella]|eukprot:XP_013236298.1 hypothetical protein ETH_00027800 [Eimeria tenella]